MNMNKTPVFCSLFNIGNQHLLKDHGLISYGMMKYKGFKSFLATYKNGDYPNLKYLPGVELEFIPNVTGNFIKDACTWLKENARRIDLLYTFHVCRRTEKFSKTYKQFNPNGKIYIEMDGYKLSKLTWFSFGNIMISRPYQKYLMKNAFISTEFQEKADMFTEKLNHKIGCVPNPINPDEVAPFRNFKDRSNIIFTAGRLGATEILLNAFAKISEQIPNWKLKLAGGFAENLNIASDFYKEHPNLKDRVIFTGEINDRTTLIEMYRDAKIFAFPSRGESFGIALSEAMSQGCFPVVSNIETNRMLTKNFEYAYSHEVDDVDVLSNQLLKACNNENEIEIEKIAHEGMNFVNNMCGLEKCCDTIYKGLYGE